jgi:lipoyl(octanoyl) transferase
LVKIRDDLAPALPAASGSPPVEWVIAEGLVDYQDAVAEMEARVAAIAAGRAPERVWLVEHPPLYTAGTSAREEDLIEPSRFPVFRSGRGGQFTYHGPGQRVAYVMLDLGRRTPDVRRFVTALEAWLIAALAAFNLRGERREDGVGVWVRRLDKGALAADKIAAIGVRVRRWVTFHGVSLNVDPDLSHFSGIVPCGVRGQGVTSLVDLGRPVTMDEADSALRAAFEEVFGETVVAPYGDSATVGFR